MSDADTKKPSTVGASEKVPATADAKSSIAELASQLTVPDIEVARAAKRALWEKVRQSGRPGAATERQAVVGELLPLLHAGQSEAVFREVLWMLSEIGADESVPKIAALLADPAAREDARMALERIPGPRSLAALKAALATAPDDFKINLAQSLRARGMSVPGLPCQKLTPTKQTKVKPMPPKKPVEKAPPAKQ